MSAFEPAALYPIVDVTPERSPESCLALAESLFAAGAPWLQLRAKHLGSAALLELARAVVRAAARQGGRVIVNDRVDVALAAGAAGVHVGQDDLPARAVRALLAGASLVVGVSTHSLPQALAAERDGADYVGFGPMYGTLSKANPLPPRRLDDLRAVRAAVALPIVAIGGITEATAPVVLEAGASSVAMISALAAAPSPADLARRLLGLPRSPRPGARTPQ